MLKISNYVSTDKTESALFEPNTANEMQLVIRDRNIIKKVNFRRVGNNEDSTIQFQCEEYNRDTNRTKHLSFSLPANMTDLFIDHLKK